MVAGLRREEHFLMEVDKMSQGWLLAVVLLQELL